MKSLSSFTSTKAALNTNEMKHLKGGGSCGYLSEAAGSLLQIKPICGLSEAQAMGRVSAGGGFWCCYDCKTRTDALAKC